MSSRDFSNELRKLLDDGAGLDSALAKIRERGATIIESIVAVRSVQKSDLVEAKRLVHDSPAWSDLRAQHEEFLDELERLEQEVGHDQN